MKATLISSGEIINLEIPLTKQELAGLKGKTPTHMSPEDYARAIVVEPVIERGKLDVPDELVVRVRRDLILALIEHYPAKDAKPILQEADKLVTYCLTK